MHPKYPQKLYRLLNYLPILMLGILIGFLLGKSDSAPEATSTETKTENPEPVQSIDLPRLVMSPDERPTREEISDRSDENVSTHLSVPMRFFKNVGYSGIDIHEGKLLIDGALTEILAITKHEEAEIGDHFAVVLSRVWESQIEGSEVVTHDPDGETVIEVAAPSEEESQRWLDETHQVCKAVLGNVRGDQFLEIINDQMNHSLAYSAMTITVKPTSSPDLPPGEGFFEFKIESGGGTKTYGSTSVPAEIAHLVELSE